TGAGTTYCVTASVATVSYKIDSSTASTTPVQGVCSGHTADGYVVNLATNPSFESGTTGWPGAQASVSQSAVWAANGTSSIKITPTSGASTDSFTSIGCSTCLVGLSVGSTYTFSGTINIPTPQTGTLDSRARTIVAYSWIGASASLLGQSTATPNTTGSTRKSVTFTIPASTDGVQIRLYNGATTVADNSVYWDSVMLTQGSTGYSFADGNSPGWVWNGIANNATSTGPPL
ncbi:MAG: hypothetical protein JWM00_629, partial [Candidatus Saccharibacteria bacterium]|nr:hypothetical protein [Candidatus Saccharibacteria bacterium]